MPATRFSAGWHEGDAAIFARLVGATWAAPISHDDPVHRERIMRYEMNITYYQQAQYYLHNLPLLRSRDFLNLRVNYSSICKRSVEMKANWLFGQPVRVRPTPLDEFGNPAQTTLGGWESNSLTNTVRGRINQIREYNESKYWDYVLAIIGMVCGDYFVKIDCDADDVDPSITVLDPAFCFPDYPGDTTLPMRAFQIQYEMPYSDEESLDPISENVPNQRICEDWRLEVVDSPTTVNEEEDLQLLDDDELKELNAEQVKSGSPSPKLTCVYREFVDGSLVAGSERNIGIPAIPVVHGLNTYNWIARFGGDEVGQLIPLLEKYNEMFFYAERVGRTNAHAKLALGGVRPDRDQDVMKSDYDDVIYLGEKGTANVLTLPTDKTMLQFVTDALETEMHRMASIPTIAQGETEIGYGAPSGLALIIRFLPLQTITQLHRTFYARGLSEVYHICLMMDEMVIQGQEYGSVYDYKAFSFEYDWWDATPKAVSEIITDMVAAVSRAQGQPLLSLRSARERIPGIDPDIEAARVKEETAELEQQSLNAPGGGGNTGGDGQDQNDILSQIQQALGPETTNGAPQEGPQQEEQPSTEEQAGSRAASRSYRGSFAS